MVSLELRGRRTNRLLPLQKRDLLLIEDYLREIAPSRRPRAVEDVAVIYARFSSKNQKTESIQIQSDKGAEYALRHQLRLRPGQYLFADNATSGHGLSDRPQLEALRKLAREGGFTKLLIKGVDRLSRRQWQAYMLLEEFAQLGIEVHITGELSHGLLDSTKAFIDGFIAMRDREKILSDTKNGLENAAWEGRNVAIVPFGYNKGRKGEMSVDNNTSSIVLRIYQDYAAGISFKKIARMLNREGVPSPNGRKWAGPEIYGSWTTGTGILRNIKYIGIAHYNRTGKIRDPLTGKLTTYVKPRSEWIMVRKPEWKIVPDDLWRRVVFRLREEAARTAARKASREQCGPSARQKASRERYSEKSTSLFHDRYFCKCGAKMYAFFKDSNSRQLACSASFEHDVCDRRITTMSKYVEIEILRSIRDNVISEEAVEIFNSSYAASLVEAEVKATRRRDSLEKQIDKLNRRIDRIVVQMSDADQVDEDLKRNYEKYKMERDGWQTELAGLRLPGPILDLTAETVKDLKQQVDELIVKIPFVERSREDMELVATLRNIVRRVELDRVEPYGKYSIVVQTTLAGLRDKSVSGDILADGSGRLPEVFDGVPITTIERECECPRMRRSVAPEVAERLQALALSGSCALTEEDWVVAGPVLADCNKKDKRLLVDAALFSLRTGRGLFCLPAPFESRTFAARTRALIAEGWFARVLAALEHVQSPTVANLDRSRVAILEKRTTLS